ncbi:MAG: SH3 domain-containing protein, partial [Anaerolineales bacterium]
IMKSIPSILHSLILLSFLLSACAGVTDQAATQTAAASALFADVATAQALQALQTAEAGKAAAQATTDALATDEAIQQAEGSATAAAQATLDAIPPQLIPADSAACRVGPDAQFAQVANLAVGVAVRVFGRSDDGDWWQVASPDDETETCWVFEQPGFTFLGPVTSLPVAAAPSLPTNTPAPTFAPGIAARYIHTLTCNGRRLAMIRVRNLGSETYQSAVVVASDSSDTERGHSDGNNEFLATENTCPGGTPTLGPREEKYVAVSFAGTPAGDTLTVRVTVCTDKGLKGFCAAATAQFVP